MCSSDLIVTVVDDESPAITCPADTTVNCEDDRSSANTGVATATDNCDAVIDISEGDSVADGSCPQEQVITRKWTGTDDCGNSSSCAQTVTVVDDEAPVISCPADATVSCEDDRSSANTGVATSTDNCVQLSLGIAESDSVAGGSCPQEEVITRTWTATDDCGNSSSCDQVVTVVDTTPPEVQCNGYDITEFDGDDDDDDDDSVSFTATATDLCSDVRIKVGWIICLPPPGDDDDDDDDDCKVKAEGATITVLDSGSPGTVISWTAKATDDCGNITAVSCSVTVLEAEEEEEEEDDDHDHDHGHGHDKPWWWHWRHW